MQAKEIDSLKDHNAAMILKLESSADEFKEKNKELEQLTCLLEDETITTFENGKYVDEVREVIMDLLAMQNLFSISIHICSECKSVLNSGARPGCISTSGRRNTVR